MNGLNNQLNPAITQNLEVFQELARSADESKDFFSSLQDRQEIQDCPLHQDKVQITHLQKTRNVSATKLSRKGWTEKEDEKFIALKQQHPNMPWKEFTKAYFPEHTVSQCRSHWTNKLEPHLSREGKLMINQEMTQNLSADKGYGHIVYGHIQQQGLERWSEEKNKQFIALKQQQPWTLSQDLNTAKSANQKSKRQCTWSKNDNHLSKKSRTESSGSVIPPASAENPSLVVNLSQEIPPELAILPVSSPSTLQEMQKIVDFPLHHYESAVNHFQEIQLMNPLLQSFQQETVQFLANVKMTYQDMKQKLTETDHSPIIQQAQFLANFCQIRTYYFETVYQHFLSYQTNQDSKEWFISQNEEFANLYLAFLKEEMHEMTFRHLTSLKERDYYYKILNDLFSQYQDSLKKHSACFSAEYTNFLNALFSEISLRFNFLKYAEQNWESTVYSLEETFSRLQEIEVFFQSFFDPFPSSETEANIIDRLKNKISLEDFYKKQTALMTAQKEEKQAEDSIFSHEPSQIEDDFFSNLLFSPLPDQEY